MCVQVVVLCFAAVVELFRNFLIFNGVFFDKFLIFNFFVVIKQCDSSFIYVDTCIFRKENLYVREGSYYILLCVLSFFFFLYFRLYF